MRAAFARLHEYFLLLRLNKPIGVLLLLWPTLWGLFLAAQGMPDVHVLWVFVVGAVLMRSAGCAVNDFADRNFDKHVERTRNRPLTAGRIQSKEALTIALVLALAADYFAIGFARGLDEYSCCFSGGLLSVYQTVFPHAPGLFGLCIRICNSHGVCGHSRQCALAGLGIVLVQCVLDHCL